MPSLSVVVVAVAAGGALGASARFLLGRGLANLGGTVAVLPVGTLVANAVGCFFAGLLMAWLSSRAQGSELLSAFLMTGVLGGFTTFSAFSFETLRLMQNGASGLALLNVVMNVALSLCAVILGWLSFQLLLRAG